jgi:hypothetical protein
MAAALSDARHELAETAQTNLDKLNEKLGPLVSTVPQAHLVHGERYADKDSDDSDDEDPTELFHRDIGVQTSGPPSPTIKPADAPPSTIDAQTTAAREINSNLSDVDLALSSELHENGNLSSEITKLKEYLDGLMYSPPTYSYGTGIGYQSNKKEENDEIGKLKREIRAVKGVLLTTRSFPGVQAR